MWGTAALIALISVPLLLAATSWLVGERRPFPRRSTRRAFHDPGLRRSQVVHAYVYGRWPRQYIGLFINHLFARLGPLLKKRLADHYHGKVLTHEHARAILTVEREIPLRDLEHIVPYPTARNLLLQGPPEVVAFECPCRLARANPCQPTQVCLIVGQPFVDFILEHHPGIARRLTQAEAVELLEAEHRRGHLHAAYFKDACLNRFFAICNCCKCCCGGIDAMVNHGIPMMCSSGYVAEVDATRCAGDGRCQEVCPFEAIHVDGRAVVDEAKCLGCGVCVGQCPAAAVSLRRDPDKGIPLDARLLTNVENGAASAYCSPNTSLSTSSLT
jgi:ferredoxin